MRILKIHTGEISTKEGVRTRETDFSSNANAVTNITFELAFAFHFHDQKRLHLIHIHLPFIVTAL